MIPPERARNAVERLRLMRHARMMEAPKPDPFGSLVPLLKVSVEVSALDTAIEALEQVAKDGAH